MEDFLKILKDQISVVSIKWLIILSLIIIILDVIIGVFVSIFITKDFDSRKLTDGCSKKVLYIFMITLCVLLDYTIQLNYVVTRFYCFTTIVANIKSIFENTNKHIITPDLKLKS